MADIPGVTNSTTPHSSYAAVEETSQQTTSTSPSRIVTTLAEVNNRPAPETKTSAETPAVEIPFGATAKAPVSKVQFSKDAIKADQEKVQPKQEHKTAYVYKGVLSCPETTSAHKGKTISLTDLQSKYSVNTNHHNDAPPTVLDSFKNKDIFKNLGSLYSLNTYTDSSKTVFKDFETRLDDKKSAITGENALRLALANGYTGHPILFNSTDDVKIYIIRTLEKAPELILKLAFFYVDKVSNTGKVVVIKAWIQPITDGKPEQMHYRIIHHHEDATLNTDKRNPKSFSQLNTKEMWIYETGKRYPSSSTKKPALPVITRKIDSGVKSTGF